MATTQRKPSGPSRPTIDKRAWAKRAIHTVTCPSGAVVRIRIPDLSMLLAGDAVPEHLRGVALSKVMDEIRSEVRGDEPSDNGTPPDREKEMEMLRQLADLHLWLVTQTLVEPEYTMDELVSGSPVKPPDEDMMFLTQLASRELDRDAAGVKLGVEPVSRWARFRDNHKCPEDCEACQATVSDLSTVDVDAV